MSLHVFERALLSLYTDSNTLHSYLQNADAFCAELDLTRSERDGLQSIPKERLQAFQRQLHQKSLGMARKLLRGPRTISLLTLNPGGPVLLSGSYTQPTRTELSRGQYQILHRLARTKEPLTILSLVRACLDTPPCTPGDLFRLISFTISKKVQGYTVRIPFIL